MIEVLANEIGHPQLVLFIPNQFVVQIGWAFTDIIIRVRHMLSIPTVEPPGPTFTCRGVPVFMRPIVIPGKPIRQEIGNKIIHIQVPLEIRPRFQAVGVRPHCIGSCDHG